MNVGQETSGIAKTACIERGSPWENCLGIVFPLFVSVCGTPLRCLLMVITQQAAQSLAP
jgi:hypothetical protein